MTDRLKSIWTGFAQTTERHLTGKGVDNIIVPPRADYDGEDRRFLPEGFESPAERAFAALRADLEAKERKFRKPMKASAAAGDMRAPAGGEYPGEKKWGSDDLNVGLWSTAMRTERTELDYSSFMASDEGKKALKRARKTGRKKRFGIF